MRIESITETSLLVRFLLLFKPMQYKTRKHKNLTITTHYKTLSGKKFFIEHVAIVTNGGGGGGI